MFFFSEGTNYFLQRVLISKLITLISGVKRVVNGPGPIPPSVTEIERPGSYGLRLHTVVDNDWCFYTFSEEITYTTHTGGGGRTHGFHATTTRGLGPWFQIRQMSVLLVLVVCLCTKHGITDCFDAIWSWPRPVCTRCTRIAVAAVAVQRRSAA